MKDDIPRDELEDIAGTVGRRLAAALLGKVIDTIDGYPTQNPDERDAIALIVARGLRDYATGEVQ